jgi:putative tryptophan/tyrosine transport system substrate-binding protein
MRRRDFFSVIAGATAWPLGARAAQAAMPVIGFLQEIDVPPLLVPFRQGLAEAGYAEGKNLVIAYRYTDFKPQLRSEAARDLARLNVDVIFAAGPDLVTAARNATTSIPIVAVDLETDPLAKGYIKSLAHPGGNMTGIFLDLPELIGKQLGLLKEIVPPELIGKQLGLLKEIVPRLSRIAIIGIPGLNAAQFEAAQTVAGAVGIEAEIIEVQVADDFEGALEASGTKHVNAGILLSSPLVYGASKQIGELAIAKRLPLISLFAVFPQSGGLISYGPNLGELYRRCGDYVAKILHGAKPSDLPIQRPEKFDLVINLKTATALGVDIPTQLQQLADDVIE